MTALNCKLVFAGYSFLMSSELVDISRAVNGARGWRAGDVFTDGTGVDTDESCSIMNEAAA